MNSDSNKTPAKLKATHVIPAPLPKSFDDLKQKLDVVAGLVPWVQIDVVDGIFAPNKTWPYIGDGAGNFLKIVNQEEGLPHWDDVSFEIDLMVSNPMFEADKWIAVGAERIVVHIKSIAADQFTILAKNIKDKGVALILGVALDVPIDTIHIYMNAAEEAGGCDGIQCMGIKRVGFQGESLDDTIYMKLQELRKAFPEKTLIVDGGVRLDNAEALAEAGANRLVCGSSIFTADSPKDTIREIERYLSTD